MNNHIPAYGASREEWERLAANPAMLPDLLPVICDLSVQISPQSSLSSLGRAPSRINAQQLGHGIKDWPNRMTTLSDVESWSRDSRLGICLQTRNHKVFDVDVTNPALAEQIKNYLRPKIAGLACCGIDNVPLRHRENSSKFALLIRCDAIMSKKEIQLIGENKVEFLGNGQQAVVMGTHPSGSRIRWDGNPSNPPILTQQQINVLWDSLTQFLELEGVLLQERQSQHNVTLNEDFMAGFEQRLGLSVEQMEALLAALDPDMARDIWIRIGMALHHECEGDDTGFILWDDWSAKGATYPGTDALRAQWDSFKASMPGKPRVTMRSVIRMALASGNITSVEDRVALKTHLKSGQAEHHDQQRFRIFSPSELAARAQPQWLIKGIMPEKSLMMVYGKSGSSKTFAVLDAAAHMGLGKDWNGRKTIRGRTIYIAAEGGGAITKRLQALALALNVELDQLNIGCIVEPPNFLEDGDIDAIILRLREYGPVSLVITDTLAQVTPGSDENASVGMGVAIANAQRIIREIQTAVLLVHHAGKDESRGARGWSGLRAAMDAEFEVRSRGDIKELKVTKMKDGEEGQMFAFRLEQHDVGVDADGEPINSCTVRYIDYVPQVSAPRGLGKAQNLLLRTREKLDMFDEGISRGELLDKATATVPAPNDGKKDNRRSNLERTLKGLIEQGHIIEQGGLLFEGGG